ncbi:type VII toxin-antitoxin system HepT family RNase toxin [Anaerobacillus isosaccharinicus]|uniref:DUF86 domain-containing protein n=1 Tax=Anaerobacillus isosaccharinicus TaxID=1532552 RepID=A0A1S2MDI1_9BACI|nr:DUF86 domain-containing protein [Anaerobacillus isosaccharinicus]MBA5588559.1 DUF86 domain-containing protein [Anaerobacillus isosaccharinicus]QOY38025.1 DUF86 domain-containing protein [Anaerobacillus isosaccharinicus]
MYFVDRKTIDAKLSIMDEYLQFYNSKTDWSSFEDKLSLERVVHIVIEAIIDVGNSIIDGFVMRDPGSYEDIIEILLDEKVIDENDATSFKKVVALRTMVVRDYTKVDHELVKQIFTDNAKSLINFAPSVHKYLKNELGHVTAFIPE